MLHLHHGLQEDPFNAIMAGAMTGGFLQLRAGLRPAMVSAITGGCLLVSMASTPTAPHGPAHSNSAASSLPELKIELYPGGTRLQALAPAKMCDRDMRATGACKVPQMCRELCRELCRVLCRELLIHHVRYPFLSLKHTRLVAPSSTTSCTLFQLPGGPHLQCYLTLVLCRR